MQTIATRLKDGQDLFKEIGEGCEENNIQAGVILSAVGSLRVSNIRVPVIDGNVEYIYPTDVEIDGLQGTVSVNGCHLHISVSGVDGKLLGGHIKEGCIVRTTCELVIGILSNTIFTREDDLQTGYDELVIKSFE